jgi:hypothetical protein
MSLIFESLFGYKIADMMRLQLFELILSDSLSRNKNLWRQLQDGINCMQGPTALPWSLEACEFAA